MRDSVKSVLIIAATIVVAGAVSMPFAVAGSGSAPVVVTNPASSPVPVTGSVNVGNLPATQPVSGTVRVAASTPFVGRGSDSRATTVASASISSPDLLIETVSVEMFGGQVRDQAQASLTCQYKDTFVVVHIPLRNTTFSSSFAQYDGLVTDLRTPCDAGSVNVSGDISYGGSPDGSFSLDAFVIGEAR